MPQFSIKDLLIATTLIALGVVLGGYFAIAHTTYAVYETSEGSLKDVSERVPVCWPLAGAMIGAGILYPFKRAKLGLLLGLASQAVLFVYVYFFKIE